MIAMQLCEALDLLHCTTPPVIYRDLKPSNVMLTPEDHLVLIDFGAARQVRGECEEDTELLGTKGFAAPEQYGGLGESDSRTDIYSFGVTLAWLLENTVCVLPEDFLQVHKLHAIIYKCTKQNPDHRFSSSRSVLEALRQMNEESLPDLPAREQTTLLNRPGISFQIDISISFVQNPNKDKE